MKMLNWVGREREDEWNEYFVKVPVETLFEETSLTVGIVGLKILACRARSESQVENVAHQQENCNVEAVLV